jgi:ADP-ribosyl-[dinitrogen reductase] hydrolase
MGASIIGNIERMSRRQFGCFAYLWCTGLTPGQVQPDIIPDAEFEKVWARRGPELRAILRSGFNVLVHCKGGLGRAGMIAARLLVELGSSPADAVKAVRKVRPGAIETSQQLDHVMACVAVPEEQPGTSILDIRDRAGGAMIGLALGDAWGTTLEYSPRDSQPWLESIEGGGPFHLEPGQWTDDTAMALCLMDSLLTNPDLDEADLMRRFARWHEHGENSCTGRCFDIGITTSTALARFKQSGDPFAGSTNPRSAGNGSLMRLAPVSIRHWNNPAKLRDVAARQSRTTHGAPEAVDACVIFAEMLADAIAGKPRSEVMRARDGNFAGKIGPIMAGSWRPSAAMRSSRQTTWRTRSRPPCGASAAPALTMTPCVLRPTWAMMPIPPRRSPGSSPAPSTASRRSGRPGACSSGLA